MHLHRSNGKSDWHVVPEAQRNVWQRMAAGTNGAVTPGNMFTVAGLALVILGLILVQMKQYWPGASAILAGRLCDLADGLVADRTGTKSSLGEKLDAGFDKLASVAAFVLLVTAHVVPVWAAVLLVLPNLFNALLTVLASRHAFTLHPNRYGKLAMAACWAALGLYLLAACLRMGGGTWLWRFAGITTVIALILGMLAATGYAKTIRHHPR